MQDNASVSGNTASAYASSSANSYGGGVYVMDGGILTVQGNASISGNTAAAAACSYGGGVYVANGGTLAKNGGVIYGSGETGIDAGSQPLKNTAQSAGSAISKNATQNRDTTAGMNLNFTTGVDSGWWDYELYTAKNQAEMTGVLNSIRTASGITFTILVSANFSSSPISLVDAGYSGKSITLRGAGGTREISLSSQGSLFTIGSGSSEPVFALRDIALKGINSNNTVLVKVDNGALIMKDGSSVIGNTNFPSSSSSYGGGVYVADGGTFIMQGGASVNGNKVNTSTANTSSDCSSHGGGVYVADGGTFIMQGGASVSGNTASIYSAASFRSYYAYGGGVYVAGGGSFTMQDSASTSGNTTSTDPSYHSSSYYSYGGGVYVADGGSFTMQDSASISGNTSSTYASGSHGGGVYVMDGGTLVKTGGVIYGSDEAGTGSDGNALRNAAQTAGHAVYYNASTPKYRNTTVGPDQNLSTGSNDNWSD
jgi:hypothetical protein